MNLLLNLFELKLKYKADGRFTSGGNWSLKKFKRSSQLKGRVLNLSITN